MIGRPDTPSDAADEPGGRAAAERIAAARLEQELRDEVEHERARTAALRSELDVLRSSESFRIGHALVTAMEKRLLVRPSAVARATLGALTPRRSRGGSASAKRLARGSAAAKPPRPRPGNVALFVAWGADEARLAEYAERIERVKTMLVDVDPVLLVDTTAIGPLRERGYRCEYLIPLEEWEQRRAPHEWAAYVTDRVAALRRAYRPRTVIVFEREGVASALEQGVLNAILLPSMGSGDDNRL